MKIERISDNQIRCTLTKADLEERNIRLTELAYGTEKAKQLFREMMMKAYRECGWTNEGNIPLMIEAIPDHGNALVLLITKVDDPEELDTRFSKFTATDVLPDGEDGTRVEGADDILDVFHKFFDQFTGKRVHWLVRWRECLGVTLFWSKTKGGIVRYGTYFHIDFLAQWHFSGICRIFLFKTDLNLDGNSG